MRFQPRLALKVGGSLAEDPLLLEWLDAAAALGGVVIVPGGGPYAELVRASRVRWRYGATLAMRMTLLGMQQYGTLMCGLRPNLAACSTRAQFELALQSGGSAVWLPQQQLCDTESLPDLPEPSVDHLAAWLAARLQVPCLALVKSCELPDQRDDMETLVECGAVDAGFADLMAPFACQVLGLHKSEAVRLASVIA